MNKLLKVMLLLVLAVGSFSVYSGAQATNHVLKGTYINNGNYGNFIAADTYTAIDTPLTVDCPGTGTCTIEGDIWMYINSHTVGGNLTLTCLYVDGAQTNGCFTDYTFLTQFLAGTYLAASQPVSGLAPGSHTVQAVAWADGSVVVGRYTCNYRVYKP